MTSRGSVGSTEGSNQAARAAGPTDEGKGDVCEAGGCCGMMTGRGGRLRAVLLIVMAVVVVVLLVYGFSTAG